MQYRAHVEDIIRTGSYVPDRTGTGCFKKHALSFHFSPEDPFPIILDKYVAHEAAKCEGLWIYQDMSNDVNLLREKYGVNVWNEWADERGTIGKAYGYQVKKHDQINRLIAGLKGDPYSRRHRIQLWSEEDAAEMMLEPCAFLTMWDYEPLGHKLNLTLIQRSGDMGLGVPFNMTQYAILHKMIAQCVGMNIGEFHYFINNAHVYVNHVNALREQLSRNPVVYTQEAREGCFGTTQVLREGTLKLTPGITDFYAFTPEDIKLEGYVSHPKIKMEVSV